MRQRKKALQVTVNVKEPSVVVFTVNEDVQLDRLKRAGAGYVAERCGDLLAPGKTRLTLEPGLFYFRTLTDTQLQVIQGGIDVATKSADKDPWPIPPPDSLPSAPMPGTKGDDVPGELPHCTVV
jgi:hypothetical protein